MAGNFLKLNADKSKVLTVAAGSIVPGVVGCTGLGLGSTLMGAVSQETLVSSLIRLRTLTSTSSP